MMLMKLIMVVIAAAVTCHAAAHSFLSHLILHTMLLIRVFVYFWKDIDTGAEEKDQFNKSYDLTVTNELNLD